MQRGAGGQAAARDSSLPTRAKMAGDEAGVTLGQPHLSRQDLGTLVSAGRGALSSEIGLPGLGRGTLGAEGPGRLLRAGGWGVRPEGLRSFFCVSAQPMRSEGAQEAVMPRPAQCCTLGDKGTRAEGRAAAQGAGPAGPGGCGAPGRGASPHDQCEAQRVRVPFSRGG